MVLRTTWAQLRGLPRVITGSVYRYWAWNRLSFQRVTWPAGRGQELRKGLQMPLNWGEGWRIGIGEQAAWRKVAAVYYSTLVSNPNISVLCPYLPYQGS